ncbi:MAG: hypothetical protein JWN17_866, partial [Frankiales bacterium]|nr:hypothetical protein [Frankiales bacterium]
MSGRSSTWAARPVLGALVRVGVLVVPLVLAVGSAVLLTRVLPPSDSLGGR